MLRLILSLTLLLSVVLPSSAAPWNTRNISMTNGLPTNTVRGLVQDKDGFIWMGTDNGLCRYDSYNVRHYRNPSVVDQYVSAITTYGANLLVGTSSGAYVFDVATATFSILDKRITAAVNSFAIDADGNVWVGTNGRGVYCYSPDTKTCMHHQLLSSGSVACVYADNTNQVWALGRHGLGLYHYNRARKVFDHVGVEGYDSGMALDGMCLAQGLDGSLLIGTWERGLIALHRDGTTEQLVSPLNGMGTHIHTIYNDTSGSIYIGCEEGLLRYDLQRRESTVVTGNGNAPAAERFVYAVMRDREGGLWMGTFYGGVTYFSPIDERFTSFAPDGMLLRGSVVSRFCEQGARIWVGTDDGGLSCYDTSRGAFTDYPGRAVMREKNVHGLWADNDMLWVGTYGNGLIAMNTTTGATKTYLLDGPSRMTSCYAVMRDRRGRLWATSMENANVYDAKTDAFRLVKKFGYLTVDIEEDRSGNVWFATEGSGLWRLSAKGQWRQYKKGSGETELGSSMVNCVRQDQQGRLLVATDNGLYEYNAAKDCFRRISVQSPDQNFMGIVVSSSEIYLTSAMGLVRHAPGSPAQTYVRSDGLAGGPYQPNACMMASDGRVWVGSVHGLNAFYPYQIKVNSNEPPVFITNFEFPGHNNAKMDSMAGRLSHAGRVELDYDENMFSIHFAALSYVSPEKNRYRYRLVGFDDDWMDAGTDHRITYTNIPPGSYTFELCACNNDGVWTKQPVRLDIVIHPPFYWSLPAKILYLLLIAAAIYYYVHLRLRRAERRHQRELKAVNDHKEQEIREARLRFFTMIAHEVRTPVTLIIGPLEKLKEQWAAICKTLTPDGQQSAGVEASLDVIDRNAHRLLDLINQLLDYNKVRQQGMSMHFQLCNIAQLMSAVAVRFEPTLRQKGIDYEVEYPEEGFAAIVDGEAVTKVMSNFMTNASKYTRTKIRMTCRVDDGTFSIAVEDDGIGVAKDEQEKIFSEFYQARDNKPGTGIGLSTVKMLVEAHHGTVGVESEPGQGSVFTMTLPIKQDVALGDDNPAGNGYDNTDDNDNSGGSGDISGDNIENSGDDTDNDGNVDGTDREPAKATMLIVEDDEDMRHFIASNFSDSYDVLTAGDGTEALKVIKKQKDSQVSIIVSDWMMPGMDGAELCAKIRENVHTSHIPFIMLTARTDDESKVKGMDIGADAYIEKPFSMKYLEACIRNLTSRRRMAMEKFANTPSASISQIADNTTDNKILTKMYEIIEENLSNPELSVNFVAEQMRMSRSGLFAKIKSLTDVTPNEMIQVVRLRKAAQLLSEGEHTVSEISFMVGFNSSSYFAKCFQKQFGIKPSEFREQ